MTQPEAKQPAVENRPAEACWSRIGVQGDRSCPTLEEAVHCRNCAVFSEAGQRLFQREAPPEYLEEWTRQLAQSDTSAPTDSISFFVFRIGPEWLALEARWVVEVISPRRIHRVPHRTDRLLLGLANIRGELQLCISLQELLGIEAAPADPSPAAASPAAASPAAASPAGARPRLIVAEHERNRWVFPVDEVEGVHRIPTTAMENLPHTVQRSAKYCSQALFCYDNKRVGALSASRLFQALERTVR